MQLLAQTISMVLSPLTLLSLLLLFAIERTQLNLIQSWSTMAVVFGAGVFPSLVSLFYLKQTGRISDLGVSNRAERYKLSLPILLFGLMTLFIVYFIDAKPVINILLILLLSGFIFTCITFWWKISAHLAVVTMCSLTILYWKHIPWWWSLPIILAVGWSRIYLKKHTIFQVLGGFGLAFVIYYWATYIEKLIY